MGELWAGLKMAAALSSYEQQRLKNIAENRRVLQSLGLLGGGILPTRKQASDSTNSRRQQRKQGLKRKRNSGNENPSENAVQASLGFDGCYRRRWSRRLEGKEPHDYGNLDGVVDGEDESRRTVIKRPSRISENVFGAIPGIPVGMTWYSRLDCSRDGVHRPTVAGIHGNESEGCYSIALSGGYEDDLDCGLAFTYTGAGGRDLKGTKANPKNLRTAPQSKDQTLTRSNLALSRNVENRRSVRVIRGFKLDSPYAPEEGYRYDGLYTVERFWETVGLSGFMVYKFALKRCDDQGPCPWKLDVAEVMNGESEEDEEARGDLEMKVNGDTDMFSPDNRNCHTDSHNGKSSTDQLAEAKRGIVN